MARALRFWVESNRRTARGQKKGLDGLNEIIAANRSNKYLGAKQERENLANVISFTRAAMLAEHFAPINGKARVTIEIIEPNHKRDTSNVIAATKFLLDGITRPRGKKPGAGLIVDDSQSFCELVVSVRVKRGEAGAFITVEEIEE